MSEPISLNELFASLAAAVANTARAVAASNERLDDVVRSGSVLPGVGVPAIAIEEVRFEVPYVVTGVREAVPPAPELAARRDVTLSETDLASLRRGVDDETGIALNELLDRYADVKKLYHAVEAAPLEYRRGVALPRDVDLSADHVAQLERGASRRARDRLVRLLEDYRASRASLSELTRQGPVAEAKDVLVSLEPEAIVSGAVNKAAVTFRVSASQAVDVEGRSVALSE